MAVFLTGVVCLFVGGILGYAFRGKEARLLREEWVAALAELDRLKAKSKL